MDRQLLFLGSVVLLLASLCCGLHVSMTKLSTVYLPECDADTGEKTFSLNYRVLETIAFERESKIIYGVGEWK